MRGLTSIKEKKLPAGATAGASDYFIYGKHTDCSRNVDKNAPEGPKTVFLWLGARVMLEYSYEEATTLLEKNLQVC